MNAADQEAGNRAIDSLINFETVKVSCNLSVLDMLVIVKYWVITDTCLNG